MRLFWLGTVSLTVAVPIALVVSCVTTSGETRSWHGAAYVSGRLIAPHFVFETPRTKIADTEPRASERLTLMDVPSVGFPVAERTGDRRPRSQWIRYCQAVLKEIPLQLPLNSAWGITVPTEATGRLSFSELSKVTKKTPPLLSATLELYFAW
jgi:hypothetical protein